MEWVSPPGARRADSPRVQVPGLEHCTGLPLAHRRYQAVMA